MAAILTAPVNWLGFGASGAVNVREMSESALRIGPARSSARGVGSIRPSRRSNSGSSSRWRNRLSALLIAGWLIPL